MLRSTPRVPGGIAVLVLTAVLAACSGSPPATVTPTGQPSTAPTAAPTGPSGSLTRVTLMLDFLPGPKHLGFYHALEAGLYEDAGLAVEIIPGRGSVTTTQIIAAGSETFGFADASAVANLIGQEAPIKVIGGIVQQSEAALAYLCDTAIDSPEALRGKRVAGPAGTFVWQFLFALLDREGIPQTEVEQVIVDAAAQTSTVLAGDADARVSLHSDRGLEVAAEGEGKEACDFIFADYGLTALGHSIIANESVLTQQPEVVRAFLAATIQGFEAAAADPATGIAALMKRNPNANEELLIRGWPFIVEKLHTEATANEPIGWMSPDDWEASLTFWTDNEIIESRLDSADEYFTNEFHPEP
jgi:NitT/TauT family transport system substrate-binding protein